MNFKVKALISFGATLIVLVVVFILQSKFGWQTNLPLFIFGVSSFLASAYKVGLFSAEKTD